MGTVKIHRVRLEGNEERDVFNLARSLTGPGTTPLIPMLEKIALAAQELPRRLRAELREFKSAASCHALCISHVFDEPLPDTPKQHRVAGLIETAYWFDIVHLMYASLLGEPFSWSSIQNGYILNDVMPLSDRENATASYGSAVPFELHTEDAFHICAGEYLGLMCIRNPSNVRTLLSTIEVNKLTKSSVALLQADRYVLGANVAHEVDKSVDPMPILFGNQMHPYFRINVNNISVQAGDTEAELALSEFITVLKTNVRSVNFRPGEYWFIDNYRVAHGRESFQPQYDGGDRWLRRVYITESLRRSAGLRHWPDGRTIHPINRSSTDQI